MLILTQEKKSRLYLSNYIAVSERLPEETVLYTARFKEEDRHSVSEFLNENIKGLYVIDDGVFATGAEDRWLDFIILKKNIRTCFSYHNWTELNDKYIKRLKDSGYSIQVITNCINHEFKLKLTCNAIQQRLKTLRIKEEAWI